MGVFVFILINNAHWEGLVVLQTFFCLSYMLNKKCDQWAEKFFVLQPRTTSAISSNGSSLSFLWASLRGQVGFFIPFLPWPSKSFQCHTKAVIIKAQFPSFSP